MQQSNNSGARGRLLMVLMVSFCTWWKQTLQNLQHSRDNRAAQTLWHFTLSRVAFQGPPGMVQPGLTPTLGCSQILLFLLTDPCLCPDLNGHLFRQESLFFLRRNSFSGWYSEVNNSAGDSARLRERTHTWAWATALFRAPTDAAAVPRVTQEAKTELS